MDKKLLEVLACPVSHGQLFYHTPTNELFCPASGLAYPIDAGIPVLLEDKARPLTEDEKSA
ncbi:Trm112 family protein [Oceanospirillaceae bacterium]|jgi:uncharacterized protein YbaR (Trm112 family)|uniref:Trm112 family protein n=1 Tax=Candidatus Njordibacter sp. Uisw_002 TaxID=3230971 RepID=UPI00233D76DF|nr:Trm112 family protein [Oceanospirillaceae bacterium]MDB9752927.1 Trm112 family protein [Oceanospirillaceae bacterium]MDB9958343.1 Trm112 family protein [Oceanospirillaceae bacterium]MDB9972582.1 Trm112 family protein [Oceanospirillaceae bacterium]MDC1341624.1 Trm112 family protein [Oceanospirillaceae bacterium]|tara:strand:+ start:73 stop:255 length:183 start_codon:yes stop_codon:yes gene_type:complete